MKHLDVIIPVMNEAESIVELTTRIHIALSNAHIGYQITFIDDHSSDDTIDKIRKVAHIYPVQWFVKQGKKGKAYSILEGVAKSNAEYVAMIDGDLQYPPEVLPELYAIAVRDGIAVANRKVLKTSLIRRLGTKADNFIFQRLLHGLQVDTQSGLKVFRREIIEHISIEDIDGDGWALDLPLLNTGIELGYQIGSVDIEFEERKSGQSKTNFFTVGLEIALNAIKLKLKGNKVYAIKPSGSDSPIGAGLAYKSKRFITHTLLLPEQSAFQTFYLWQKIVIGSLFVIVCTGLVTNTTATVTILLGILTGIYAVDFLFSTFLVIKSLHHPPEMHITQEQIEALRTEDLPVYTVLCPLYKEANILPHFVESIHCLDWPREKLDVQLLLEEDDTETITAARQLNLPDCFRILIVPHSLPKTKPKACNYGFAQARGDFVVIYDAEDRPDPLQLKKAYIGFRDSQNDLVCLQSKLNYYNTDQNILTRLFTVEYSLWFDLILPGLQSLETTIPLGGTSNHFRTKELRKLHAWDPFNVTEDCDLGVRLFKEGKRTAIIDSTTYEEANSVFAGWLKQRSRWIKGYMQTYLVHVRSPVQFVRQHGIHAAVFQLVIGLRMAFILINPLLWMMTIAYFAFYDAVGPTIESLYPPAIFYPAVLLLVFGNFLYLYNYMIGAAKRGQWSVIKYVFLIPMYWIMTSIAAGIAFYQLLVKPHYWEKTTHGLHLEQPVAVEYVPVEQPVERKTSRIEWALNSTVSGGTFLVISSVVGNISNFLYNAYLGRTVSVEEFGTISLLSSIFALSSIVTGAVGGTVTFKTAWLLGRIAQPTRDFWARVFWRTAGLSVVVTGAWVIVSPFLATFFNTESILPFLLFTPAWSLTLAFAVNQGYLSGSLKFLHVGLIVIIEALTKLAAAVALVEIGYTELVYISIPVSISIAFLLSLVFIKRTESIIRAELEDLSFPKRFFGASLLSSVSIVAFLSFDVILAKYFLSPTQAGEYALLSLVGKMIFFLGSLFAQFITPLVSHTEGAEKSSVSTFYKILAASTLVSLAGYVFVGILGSYTVPILLGEKAASILSFLPLYGLAIVAYATAANIINYHQIKKQYLFPVIGFIFALFQGVGVYLSTRSLHDFVYVIAFLAFAQIIIIGALHVLYQFIPFIWSNMVDFAGVFNFRNRNDEQPDKLRILIFNWRDTRHKWAGGAEVYTQELAKRWVEDGHTVTLFCGNDGDCERNEMVDGVEIIRRGGLYMVYVWAFLYFVIRFRGKYDVVIDCENAIPFFTPLYTRIPKVLLIHHVHQEVFRKHLSMPLAVLATLLESKLMPFLYRKTQIITVSNSSRQDILAMGWSDEERIAIVNPGIEKNKFVRKEKTLHPTFVYLGRLQHYKNIDVAIRAFAEVYTHHKTAELLIAGFGQSRPDLEDLTRTLGLRHAVTFLGFVDEERKKDLLATSWAMVQPSSFEGWGITVTEANASGTPVIASRVRGLSDSVADGTTGILFPVGDVGALASVMTTFIEDTTLRTSLTENAYIWSSQFEWDESAQAFLSIVKHEVELSKEAEVFIKRFATSLRSLFWSL